MIIFTAVVCGLMTMVVLMKIMAICTCALLTVRQKRKANRDKGKAEIHLYKKASGGVSGVSGKQLAISVLE